MSHKKHSHHKKHAKRKELKRLIEAVNLRISALQIGVNEALRVGYDTYGLVKDLFVVDAVQLEGEVKQESLTEV